MGFFNRVSRLLRANVNDLVSKAEDPVKILDQSVADMQEDLVKLRQAVAMAIASQKRLRNQAEQAEAQSRTWYERAELALKKNEEDLPARALTRRKTFQETATSLAKQVQGQDAQVETLKKSRWRSKARSPRPRPRKTCSRPGPRRPRRSSSCRVPWATWAAIPPWRRSSAWRTRSRSMEASSQAAAELAGADLESQFAALEGGDDVDDELAALRQQLGRSRGRRSACCRPNG